MIAFFEHPRLARFGRARAALSMMLSSDGGRAMSRIKPFFAGALAGAALVYVGLQYHLIRSDDGFYLISRTPQASLGLAYADIRDMTDEEFAKRPELARALAAHSARKLLANKIPEEAADAATTLGADPLDAARRRLNSAADDWPSDTGAEVPRPPAGSLDAPLWNPFAEDDGSDAEPLGETATPPADENFPFSDDSPFADITDQLDEARDTLGEKLDAYREPPVRTRESFTSVGGDAKPFDLLEQPESRHTTNRVTVTDPAAGSLTRDERSRVEIRRSLNRRAREIYERSRQQSLSRGDDALPSRSGSRADSVIDELVSPHEAQRPVPPARGTRSAQPQRYQRWPN